MNVIDRDLATEAMNNAIEKQFDRIDQRTTERLIKLAKITSENGSRVMSRDAWHELIMAKAASARKPCESSAQAFVRYLETNEGGELFRAFKVESMREMVDPCTTAVLPADMAKSAPSYYPTHDVMSQRFGGSILMNAVEDYLRAFPELIAMGTAGRRKALAGIIADPKTDVAVLRAARLELETLDAGDAARDGGAALQQAALQN